MGKYRADDDGDSPPPAWVRGRFSLQRACVRACVCKREKERGDESYLVRLVEEGGFIFWRGGI